MNIAVNTRLLLPDKLEGIGRFAHEILQRVVKDYPQHTFYFLFDRAFHEEYVYSSNVIPVAIVPQARHPLLFWIWFEISLPRWLRKHNIDLFFSPDGYLSLRSAIPQIAVFHDLNFEHYPEDLNRLDAWHYRRYFPKYAEKALKLITVSQFSKNEIVRLYKTDPSKISVVHNGVSHEFKGSVDSSSFKNLFTSSQEFFLVVGSIHPRKNTTRILAAFENFRAQSSKLLKLVFVGDAYLWSKEMRSALTQNRYKADIIFTGHLRAKNLHEAYAAATGLCFVSYYEGFGIPLIEAMACECPIMAAKNTVMPEIAENAAIYVDPFQIEDIVKGFHELSNEHIRQPLIREGSKQVLKYSWDTSAQKIAEILGL